MRIMISEKTNEIHTDFQSEINNEFLCDLKNIRYDQACGPDYSQRKVQQLYLLRYFPAYLCEYKYLYQKVIEANVISSNFNILSIGCGCCVDYYGAYLALGRSITNLQYCGIDPIDWLYKDNLSNDNFCFVQGNISDITFSQDFYYNILFFPKSLSEIPQSDFNTFLSNLKLLTFRSKYIFLISSIMDKGYMHDTTRYDNIADLLRSKGFRCDNFQGAKEITNKGGLNQLDSGFDYPNDVKSFLTNLNEKCSHFQQHKSNCENECKVQLNKWPILTAKYISFQINLFER